jgi:hypothetical protein
MTPPHLFDYLVVVAKKTETKRSRKRYHYPANANHKESKMKPTAANLIRWSGLAAMGSGIIFIAMQAIHPLDVLSSVSTTRWAIVHYMGVAMGILGLFGVTGIYARQVEKAGWLGLVGYLLLSLFYVLTTAFQFIEAFVTPPLATVAPEFVEGFLGIPAGHASTVDLGSLPLVYTVTGMVGYMLGGLVFGIATFRAAVLPRWAGALLAIGVVLPLVTAAFIPHPFDRILAVPVAVALAWMGYALWSEQGEKATQSAAASSLQLQHTEAN